MISSKFLRGTMLATVLGLLAAAPLRAQSLDELHKLALKEGGTLNFYGTLAQINAERILPVFEKRFPGLKVNHIDATADKLAARAIAEARGGRTLADIFQMALENILQVSEQKLLVDWLPPEAAPYPASFKAPNWLAADMVIIIGAWNTNLALGPGIERLWWVDPAKEKDLMRAQADPSVKLEVGPLEDRYWLNYKDTPKPK